MKFSVVVAIVADSLEEKTIKVAKDSGATGVTILDGKGRGLKEKKIFFGLTLEENVSILIFVLPIKLTMKVMKALRVEFDLDSHTNSSLAFTIPLSHVAGLNNDELHQFEKEIKSIL